MNLIDSRLSKKSAVCTFQKWMAVLYAVKIYDADPKTKVPHYVVCPDGLPEGVKPKRCDCNGECLGMAWR